MYPFIFPVHWKVRIIVVFYPALSAEFKTILTLAFTVLFYSAKLFIAIFFLLVNKVRYITCKARICLSPLQTKLAFRPSNVHSAGTLSDLPQNNSHIRSHPIDNLAAYYLPRVVLSTESPIVESVVGSRIRSIPVDQSIPPVLVHVVELRVSAFFAVLCQAVKIGRKVFYLSGNVNRRAISCIIQVLSIHYNPPLRIK